MKLHHLALVATLPLLLSACGLSPQQKEDYAQVQSSHVSPAIYDKMLNDDDLSLGDIEALSRAHISPGVILRYIRDEDTVYYIGSKDVEDLQKAGVDHSVIDYMLQTAQGGYWGPGPYPYYGFGYDPFWYGPAFFGGYFIGGHGGHHWHHHH